MRVNQWMTLLAGTVLFANADASQPSIQYLQISQCLAEKMTTQYPVLAQNNDFRVIAIPAKNISDLVVLADKEQCGRFVNVSKQIAAKHSAQEILTATNRQPVIADAPAYEITHQIAVLEALDEVKVENIVGTLTELTHFKNRSAELPTGVRAAQWIRKSFLEKVAQSKRSDVDAFFVQTGSYYQQPSLVTVLNKNSHEPAVVIGAHMDTLEGRMPGAGDDGSGSASVMEVARVLLNSKIEFNRPIYIIWYAAEEKGLVGSQYVVDYFHDHKIPVKAVIQFDMTGFRNDANDPTMWVFRDYTNPPLTDFVADLIRTYIGVPVGESKCGYGCSDHASWTEINVPAAFPCETDFAHHNPNIHTSRDTMDRLTPAHMVNFAKLGLAFAIELASN